MKDTIEIAKEVELEWLMHNWLYKDHLQRFADLVRADEREACAKVCEEHPDGLNMMGGAFITCANVIRARGRA